MGRRRCVYKNKTMTFNSQKESTLPRLFVSLGLTRRSTIFLFVFLTLFLIGVVAFIFQYHSDLYSLIFLLTLLPLLIFDILLGYIALNPRFKKQFAVEEKKRAEKLHSGKLNKKEKAGRYAYLTMACQGSFVGIGIILVLSMVVLGLEDKIGIFMIIYIFLGGPLVFKLLWPYFSRKLK